MKRKLYQWRDEGFIDQASIERILAFEKQQPQKKKVPLLLMISLIFLALAIFSFIAANWQLMPDLLKVSLVLLLMWIFYGLGYAAERKQFGWPILFRLIGLAMFAASIIVTAQTFHFSLSNSVLPWAMFLAALGHYFYWRHMSYTLVGFFFGLQVLTSALPAISWVEWGLFIAITLAWFYFSKEALPIVFSWLLLFGSGLMLWSLIDYTSALWPIWTLFTLVFLLILAPQKEPILRPLYLIIGAIQLIVYLGVRGEANLSFIDFSWLEVILLAVVSIGIFGLCFIKFRTISWIAILGTVGLLLVDDTAIGIAIVAQLSALSYLIMAQRQERSLTLGFVYFIIVQFVIYVIYVWERLDMSLFFLIGALLLFILSGIGWWINRKKEGAIT
ncbi:DUF2157 domain-containing protein [Salipaludibacillus daqingensis]|uniref:DUF2157 domain-containing protein n=1 Tax=Salipaludibacillus daqingensis TaxID=3041001 RepID=UPI0031453ACC